MSSTPPPIPSLRTGIQLGGGRYELVRPLGAGGNGVLWLALHTGLQTETVVKFPKRWSGATAPDAEQFVSEMMRLASLSHLHPHIVNILDTGKHQGRPYFVMQHMTRGSLADYCGKHAGASLDGRLAQSAAWLEAIGDALDFLHARGTVHRDVKPGNILLDESYAAYLADFGIATPRLQNAGRGQLTCEIAGSLPYLAPELLAGGPASPASDQFALAVSVFEFVVGRRPFEGTNANETLTSYRQRTATWQKGMSANLIPPALGHVVTRGLHPEPRQRFHDCLTFAREASRAWGTLKNSSMQSLGAKPPLPQQISTSKVATVDTHSKEAPLDKGVVPTSPPPSSPVLRLDRLRQPGSNSGPCDNNNC